MIILLIKYFFIIMCSMYAFPKLLNIHQKVTAKTKLFMIFLNTITSFFMYMLRAYMAPISIMIMVSVSALFLKKIYRIDIGCTITTTIISFGIGYLSYIPSITFAAILEICLPGTVTSAFFSAALAFIIGMTQLTLVVCLFRINRLKHGFSFLSEAKYSDLCVHISVSVLSAASFLGMNQGTHLVYIILIFSIVICGIIFWFWWHRQITEEYLKQLNKRETEELNHVIDSQQREIEMLNRQNDELSKIIHKDNKFLPAIELSVKEFYLSVVSDENKASRTSSTLKLIEQLEQFSRERAGVVKSYELSHKKPPCTNIASIDILFTYMLEKAAYSDIILDLCLWDDMAPLIKHKISEQDLTTLLGDLLENAIIATKDCKKRRILAGIGILNNTYCICISDSGVPFPAEVLLHLGIEPVTTHADHGGSGIGLMSTFEICSRYHASLEIEELDLSLYAKQVTIRFDGLGTHKVKLLDKQKCQKVSANPNIQIVPLISTG
ncbi:MAG: GHKL domain-containing protein [Kineothrix sp.]